MAKVMIYSQTRGVPAKCIAQDNIKTLEAFIRNRSYLFDGEPGYKVIWHTIKDSLTGYEYVSTHSFDVYIDGEFTETYQIEY